MRPRTTIELENPIVIIPPQARNHPHPTAGKMFETKAGYLHAADNKKAVVQGVQLLVNLEFVGRVSWIRRHQSETGLFGTGAVPIWYWFTRKYGLLTTWGLRAVENQVMLAPCNPRSMIPPFIRGFNGYVNLIQRYYLQRLQEQYLGFCIYSSAIQRINCTPASTFATIGDIPPPGCNVTGIRSIQIAQVVGLRYCVRVP
ncbi:hypothetical protein BU24DRAFT_133447 [Aaosphaeria arxii CBS 175.79]|uniref:Uncharacterized protein n=1 Tax=Aaosphaeria arxii CBS 175.79 TaxID=1450172 RepID=A0A6A5Y495_9PLEO|nr:uncharacterized protein BU24DRAFT_133447 [Aaosphaeria arxii CBS 175.79]KAF2020099.1 hypothetical protein BU24DRAFT_133447 [Aaosphaeria arxii CBS 175.79]